MLKVNFLFVLLFISTFSFAQQKKGLAMYGIGVMHNFQTEGTAIDLRANLPLLKKLYVSPRFSLFPAFNKIHEYYIGTDVDFQLSQKHKLIPYILAGGFYNNWINSSAFHNKRSQRNNFVFECGAGLMLSLKCFHPFLEYRYDTKWLEGSLGIGIMLQFGECWGRSSATKCSKF
jgi:hypothetical protein